MTSIRFEMVLRLDRLWGRFPGEKAIGFGYLSDKWSREGNPLLARPLENRSQ